MGRLDGCREGGGRLSLVVLVSEKPNLVGENPNLISEKSGKSQGILFNCGTGNPVKIENMFPLIFPLNHFSYL